jgi:beta propeller repeat protein
VRFTPIVFALAPGLMIAAVVFAPGCHGRGVPLTGAADMSSAGPSGGGDGGVVRAAHRERCNGIDDDLDGKIDEGCPIRLTFAKDEFADAQLTVGGGRIAWTHSSWDDGGGFDELRVRALPNGPTSDQYIVIDRTDVAPSLSGDRIAYLSYRQQIMTVRDLASGQTWTRPTGGATRLMLVEEGHKLVFVSVAGGYGNSPATFALQVWDLDTDSVGQLSSTVNGAESGLASAGGKSGSKAGNEIVWLDTRNLPAAGDTSQPQPDVYLGDVDTLASRQLVHLTPPSGLGAPQAFDGTRLYIQELHDENFLHYIATGTCQLAAYDLTGARTPIGDATHLAGDACAGFAAPGSIVLLDDRRGVRELGVQSDLYLVDFDSGDQKAITHYPRTSTAPRIWDGRLVWLDDRNDRANVYMMDLRDVDEGDLSPEGMTP